MARSLIWKGLFVAAALASALVAMLPLERKLALGLDLRGGTYLALRVHTEDALRLETDAAVVRLEKTMGASRLELRRVSEAAFEIRPAGEVTPKIQDVVRRELGDAWRLQRDEERLRIDLAPAEQASLRRQAVDRAMLVIANRIDGLGVGERSIGRQGASGDRLVVQIPGVQDAERVKGLLGATALLELRLADYPTLAGAPAEVILAHYGGALPDGLELVRDASRSAAPGRPTFFALERRSMLTGADLRSARPTVGELGNPVVGFQLTRSGGERFGEATAANVGRTLAIVLDGRVLSVAAIHTRITDSGVIEGRFSQTEGQDLANVLASGALPASVSIVEEHSVGPALGADAIRQGLRGTLLGTALVAATMLVVYRGSGVNAVLALAVNLVLIVGCLAAVGATLTLPGIAGLALTVGVAVDANVLVFERIKEELRAGRTVKAAVAAGFQNAVPSILDANLCTLISALFLFQFGSGPVRGFAVTLSIGIVGTVFSALVVSRLLFDLWLGRRARVDRLSIGPREVLADRAPRPPRFDFMRYRRPWIAVSLVLVAAAIGSFFLPLSPNVGVDFAGGTAVTLEFERTPDLAAVRSTAEAAGARHVALQSYGDPAEHRVLLRTTSTGVEERLLNGLRTSGEGGSVSVVGRESVAPQVGAELRQKGAWAIGLSLAGMLAYIWLRFELPYGIGAVMATVHDVLVSAGLYLVLGLEWNLTTVAAFLTLIGYSVNDTVVTFDRVRENRRRHPGMPLVEVMNRSLDQMLSRTLLTGGTVVLAAGSLLLLGGEVLRGFATVLSVGVLVGTYSSIYIASPFALLWAERFGARRSARSAGRSRSSLAGRSA